jgi:hypothetical protein
MGIGSLVVMIGKHQQAGCELYTFLRLTASLRTATDRPTTIGAKWTHPHKPLLRGSRSEIYRVLLYSYLVHILHSGSQISNHGMSIDRPQLPCTEVLRIRILAMMSSTLALGRRHIGVLRGLVLQNTLGRDLASDMERRYTASVDWCRKLMVSGISL